MRKRLFVFGLLMSSISHAQSVCWLIGTAHDERNYINADSLTAVLNRIKPDVILVELEDKHFDRDFGFDTAKYPLKDFLVTNENIASYRYKQKYGAQLRPFDINGRHEFYEKERYNEQENKMFGEMMRLYKEDKFSADCKVDFQILLAALGSYSELRFNSLKEANSDVATKFIALKNEINFELMVSIIRRTAALKQWLKFAELRKSYWNKRNQVMAENIIKYSNKFKGKRIVVFVGNDHKYALTKILKQQKFEIRNY